MRPGTSSASATAIEIFRPVRQATMFAVADRTSVGKRTLAQDDIDAVCDIYPPGNLNQSCDATPMGGLLLNCETTRQPVIGSCATIPRPRRGNGGCRCSTMQAPRRHLGDPSPRTVRAYCAAAALRSARRTILN